MSALQLPRQMIFHPELAPHFVLVVQDAYGWSIRDYSSGKAELRFSSDLPRPVEGFLEKARGPAGLIVNAPAISVSNHRFWKHLTDELGARFLSQPRDFVSLRHHELRRVATASGTPRLLTGPSSDDWVTWNAMRLLEFEYPNGSWWARVASHMPGTWPLYTVPGISFWWKTAPSPQYKRAKEEPARVDLALESPECLIYIESKIKQDIALRTRGDKRRNRIVRLADCLLNESAGRPCAVWIFARDTDDNREYVQLIRM